MILPKILLIIRKLKAFPLIIAAALVLASCSSDDEPAPENKPTPIPEVEFTNLTANQTLWSLVPLEFSAMDDAGIKSLELYIDDKLIKTFSAPPFEYDWDTEAEVEGQHTIKLIATNSAGKTSEGRINVDVRNALVAIDVPDGYVKDTDNSISRRFIVLSDENGDVITYGEIENNSKFELYERSYQGNSFYVTEVKYEKVDEYPNRWTASEVYVFPNVSRGKWFLVTDPIEDNGSGTATMNFINAGTDVWYNFTTGHSNDVMQNYSPEFTLSLTVNSSSPKLVAQRSIEESIEYQIFPLVTGNNPPFDLGKGWKTSTELTRELVGNTQLGDGYITGYLDGQAYPLVFSYYSWDGNAAILYRPDGDFTSFRYAFEIRNDNGILIKSSPSFDTPLENIQHSLQIDMVENGFRANFTGEMDMVKLSCYDGEGPQWFFFLPANETITIVPPKLPEEVLQWVPGESQFVFVGANWYELYAMSWADSYDDLIRKSRNMGRPWELGPDGDYSYQKTTFPYEGGRTREIDSDLIKHRTSWPVKLPQNMKR